ncbi:MAG: diaminopimelate epimerase, partial [Woeseiaceae bacterium]|nr:diaminopimelate epimerase [Woeseiaceae bacterium]
VDGREAEACGNATRCVAWLLMEEKRSEQVVIETLAGLLDCRRSGDALVSCDRGPLCDGWQDIPLSRDVDTGRIDVGIPVLGEGVATSLGNPHVVFFVDDLSRVDLPAVAPVIQRDALFPEGVNVGVCRVRGPRTLELAVFERGAGLTMACGSGACAAVHAARRRKLIDTNDVQVDLPGGALEIRIDDGRAIMTGPIAYAFEGVF